MQPLQICIGPTIRSSREILCLPYAGIFLLQYDLLFFIDFVSSVNLFLNHKQKKTKQHVVSQPRHNKGSPCFREVACFVSLNWSSENFVSSNRGSRGTEQWTCPTRVGAPWEEVSSCTRHKTRGSPGSLAVRVRFPPCAAISALDVPPGAAIDALVCPGVLVGCW